MSPRNILIIKTHAIGDVLMATPAFRALRLAHPEARITLLVGKWSYPVVRHNPHIDDFVVVDEKIFFAKKVVELFRLVRMLRARHFDCAVVLHPSPMLHLFSWLCGIPQRIGLQREKKSPFLTAGVMENTLPDFYYPRNFLNLAALLGGAHDNADLEAYCSDADRDACQVLLREARIERNRPFILVAPGGARNPKESILAKLWPAEHFASLLKEMRSRWPMLPIVLSGGPGDAPLCDELANKCPDVLNLCGRTSLTELLALADLAGVVICNDSSMLHIAVSRKKEVFSFFGPTNPGTLAPLRANVHVLRSALPCSPCFHYALFNGCSQQIACMRSIAPAQVISALEPVVAQLARG